MAYSTITKPSLHFNTKLYSGNSSTQAITGVGHQPDFTWVKERNAAEHHYLFDSVRGVTKFIYSNLTNAEATNANSLTAFGADGFTLGNYADVNENSKTYASWNWKANGAGSANSDGTAANVTVSANTTAGFSIIQFDATQSRVSVGHGLGSTPDAIFMKETEGAGGWVVGGFGLDWSGYLSLQATNAFNNDNNDSSGTGRMFTPDGYAPTSSVWSTNGSAFLSGGTKTCIAYCFKSIKGYSKFGSYIGNGNADGMFVYTGFKPAWVMLKNSGNSSEEWGIWDSKRDVSNLMTRRLVANANAAENTADYLDFLSNGFKIRTTANGLNQSGNSIIYMAFAENPLVANVGQSIPATAR